MWTMHHCGIKQTTKVEAVKGEILADLPTGKQAGANARG